MLPSSLTFIDIETTGTSITYGRIIEVGLIRVDHGIITKEFSSLVNPQMPVDPFIEKLTGINRKSLASAPTFADIKDIVFDMLQDSIFVAHNVRFDYGFLRNEFRRQGTTLLLKHLCTIKLARILYPGHQKYNLDAIMSRHNIQCERRHRALDDAKVLHAFYSKSIELLGKRKVASAVNTAMKRPTIPLGITQKQINALPESAGVYVFYGDTQLPLYIGKSVNIKDRVLSHFSGDYLSNSDMNISQQIKYIDYIKTAGELSALFLESMLIKKQKPILNKKLRSTKYLQILRKTVNEDGYNCVDIVNNMDIAITDLDNVITLFRSKSQCKNFLQKIAKEKSLCPKLLGLEKSRNACFSYELKRCKGACIGRELPLKYNLRFDEAFYAHRLKPWPFQGPITIEEHNDLYEALIFDKWCYLGSMKNESDIFGDEPLDYNFDFDTYKMLLRYLSTKSNRRFIKEFRIS